MWRKSSLRSFQSSSSFATSSLLPSLSSVTPYTRHVHEISVPDFGKYMRKGENAAVAGRTVGYLMIGTAGFGLATGARGMVSEFLDSMNPAANVRALANIEVDVSTIPEGASITVKWRGKPLFIRHRTEAEIESALSVDLAELRDPQTDDQRRVSNKPEWLILLGVCTHLGCVPLNNAGDYGGWFCPCHGSHYDTSGRIRKGPAPLNLEVPPYVFMDDSKVLVGKATLD